METQTTTVIIDIRERAKLFAELVHANATYDSKPYMFHVNEVVENVKKYKHLCPIDLDIMICGAYLHDTVEDGSPAGKEMYKLLKRIFNEEVADLVFLVTNELGRNRKEQNEKTYPKVATSLAGTYLKLCDRIANVENGRRTGSRMYDVYKEEQTGFKGVICKPSALDPMWADLDNLFI